MALQVNTRVMLLLLYQDPLLFSSPFQGTLFWYSTLKKHFYGGKWDDVVLWRCGEHQMVLLNVMCEWGGGVKITFGVVASDVWGLLLLGQFPVYTNKEEMHKCISLLLSVEFYPTWKVFHDSPKSWGFFSPPKECLKFQVRCLLSCTTLAVPTRL